MQCSNCHKTIPKNIHYCAYCGAAVHKEPNWLLWGSIGLAVVIGFLGLSIVAPAIFPQRTPTKTQIAFATTLIPPTNPPTSVPTDTPVPTVDIQQTEIVAQQTAVSAQRTKDASVAQQTVVSAQQTAAAISAQQTVISLRQTQSAISAQQTTDAQQQAINAQLTAAAVSARQTQVSAQLTEAAQPRVTYVRLVNQHSQKCLTVQAGGPHIIQMPCGGGDDQLWTDPSGGGPLKSKTGVCIYFTMDHAELLQTTNCGGSPAWSIGSSSGGYYQIVTGNNYCLDVDSRSTADGAWVLWYPCYTPIRADSDNQLWASR